ncbi:ABC transporter permease [Microcella humidisoli]|uniref:ABC transporter permease n=1 Tax=Microcella humidisoli TaxID=2963406 RepID=A0ABY5FVG5_9MICO|nr:ABC transporter permease [Microcella humidisoli]UTT62292.1 ABC transporter permease [Microcella humidisoli]
MRLVLTITARNLRLFFRDRAGVVFSLMGALIVFLLYALFLSDLQVRSIAASFPDADASDVRAFVDTWMFAGIIAMTSITTSLGALAVFVEDVASGRFRDFMVSPIRRWQLVLGYLLATVVVALVMTTVVLGASIAYLFLIDGVTIGVFPLALTMFWIVLSCVAFAALWAFVVSFLRSTAAFSALATVVGTIIGFLAGAFIAIGLFPAGVRDIVNALPFAQSAMLMRQQFTEESLRALVGDQPEAIAPLSEFYGITAVVGGAVVPVPLVVALLLAYALAFTALAAWRIRSRLE